MVATGIIFTYFSKDLVLDELQVFLWTSSQSLKVAYRNLDPSNSNPMKMPLLKTGVSTHMEHTSSNMTEQLISTRCLCVLSGVV